MGIDQLGGGVIVSRLSRKFPSTILCMPFTCTDSATTCILSLHRRVGEIHVDKCLYFYEVHLQLHNRPRQYS